MLRILPLAALLLLFSCGKKKTAAGGNAPRAFYYWQTSLSSFQWSDTVYQSLNVDKVYYRFFDVDWSDETNAPVPVSPLGMDEIYSWKSNAEVIPVVFITNETFQHLSVDDSKALAHHVHHKILANLNRMLVKDSGWEIYGGYWQQDPYQVKSKNFDEHRKYDSLYQAKLATIKEVQFDCDWTASTKDKYFTFLTEALKLFKDQTVSSTIRLYQYKYPNDAGVPPVKKGMLMCYNAGSVKDIKEKNSIFEKDQVMDYLTSSSYPIPLDYALPVFEWALLYRNNKLEKILPASILDEHPSNFTGKDDHYTVAEEFVYGYTVNSTLLRRGDEVRLETPNMDDVLEVAGFLSEHKNNKDATITLYHLNDHDLKKHAKAIEDIFNTF